MLHRILFSYNFSCDYWQCNVCIKLLCVFTVTLTVAAEMAKCILTAQGHIHDKSNVADYKTHDTLDI